MATTVVQKSQRIKAWRAHVVRGGTVSAQPITFRSTTRRPLDEPLEPEDGEVQRPVPAVDDQFGQGPAHGGGLLDAMPAEAVCEQQVRDVRVRAPRIAFWSTVLYS